VIVAVSTGTAYLVRIDPDNDGDDDQGGVQEWHVAPELSKRVDPGDDTGDSSAQAAASAGPSGTPTQQQQPRSTLTYSGGPRGVRGSMRALCGRGRFSEPCCAHGLNVDQPMVVHAVMVRARHHHVVD
jgi:hypothetical protein